MAIEKGIPLALVHCLDGKSERSLFHEQKIGIIEAQATALNIPIIYQKYKWWVRWLGYIQRKRNGMIDNFLAKKEDI